MKDLVRKIHSTVFPKANEKVTLQETKLSRLSQRFSAKFSAKNMFIVSAEMSF